MSTRYYHQAPYYNGVLNPVDTPKFFYHPVIRPDEMKLVITGVKIIFSDIPVDDVSLKYRITISTNPKFDKCDKSGFPDIDERNVFFYGHYHFTRERSEVVQDDGEGVGLGVGIGISSGSFSDYTLLSEKIHTLTRLITLGYESNDDTVTTDRIWWWIYCHLEPIVDEEELWTLQHRNWLRRRLFPIGEVDIPDYMVPFRRGIMMEEL